MNFWRRLFEAHRFSRFAQSKAPMPHVSFIMAISTLLLTLLLSGCGKNPLLNLAGHVAPPGIPVKEPPHVPDLPPKYDVEAEERANFEKSMGAGLYADLNFSDIQPWDHKRRGLLVLREAVLQAIHFGILRPRTTQERFHPSRAITYGETRALIAAYNEILIEASKMAEEEGEESVEKKAESPKDDADNIDYKLIDKIVDAPTKSAKKDEAANKSKSNQNAPMVTVKDPGTATILLPSGAQARYRTPPADMSWDNHHLQEGTWLTREELCGLYSFLSHQDETALGMSPELIDQMVPAGSDAEPDEAFDQFKDVTSIGEWARPFVALAYHDNLLRDLWDLTPARLTLDEGFMPQRYATREEVMRLLYQLYGKELAKLDPEKILMQIRHMQTYKEGSDGKPGSGEFQYLQPVSVTLKNLGKKTPKGQEKTEITSGKKNAKKSTIPSKSKASAGPEKPAPKSGLSLTKAPAKKVKKTQESDIVDPVTYGPTGGNSAGNAKWRKELHMDSP